MKYHELERFRQLGQHTKIRLWKDFGVDYLEKGFTYNSVYSC